MSTDPGGIRTAPGGVRAVPNGSGRLLVGPESIDAVQLDKFDAAGFSDGVFCMLSLLGAKLVTGVCYRSPASTDENDEALLSLFKSVDEFVDKHNCVIM